MSTHIPKHLYVQNQVQPESRNCVACGQLETSIIHQAEPSGPAAPTRPEVQVIKSVRDDLCNRFRENDKLYNEMQSTRHLAGKSSTVSSRINRMKEKCEKMAKQISVLNTTIKFLETQIK